MARVVKVVSAALRSRLQRGRAQAPPAAAALPSYTAANGAPSDPEDGPGLSGLTSALRATDPYAAVGECVRVCASAACARAVRSASNTFGVGACGAPSLHARVAGVASWGGG